MLKSLNIRKAAASATVAAVLGGVFGIHAAVANRPEGETIAPHAITVEGRDEAASRGAARASIQVRLAGQVLTEQVEAAHIEAAALDHYRVANIGVANGTLNKDDLCKLSWTNKSVVRCDAANAFERLNEAFKARFGYNIEINDSYRSFEKQVSVRNKMGKIAAVPGYSNHGLGVALDLGSDIPDASSPQHKWMVAHAGDFGWVNPEWARTTKIEPWHWEFAGIKS